jgi:hypothetical protein
MRLLRSAFIVAALALASPVWAHGGHGHGHGHKHHGHHDSWDDRRGHGKWKHHRHHGRHVDRRVIVSQQYYYPAYPVYAAPAPGVHIVVPNIYIPLR